MHGMICKSLEGYVENTHGPEAWRAVRSSAGLPPSGFEPLLSYDDALFLAMQDAASEVLALPATTLMEDVGTWICTHPPLEPVRRLFRFSGSTFLDLLLSLDEIDARARMAVPELELPSFRLAQVGEGEFEVQSTWTVPGAGGLLSGALRAMADEYGALAIIEIVSVRALAGAWRETVIVRLVEEEFHTAKAFSLGGAG